MKILLALVMIGLAQAQSYVTSTVGFDGSKYHYEYIVDAEIGKKEVDSITIDLSNSSNLYDLYTNYKYDFVDGVTYIKFDKINNKGEEFLVFGFYSNTSPEYNNITLESGKNIFTDFVWTPSSIPEINSLMYMTLGSLVFLKRRR